jgi:hypothetical protein
VQFGDFAHALSCVRWDQNAPRTTPHRLGSQFLIRNPAVYQNIRPRRNVNNQPKDVSPVSINQRYLSDYKVDIVCQQRGTKHLHRLMDYHLDMPRFQDFGQAPPLGIGHAKNRDRGPLILSIATDSAV